jgi:periplasmic divalent cation tolerance protein
VVLVTAPEEEAAELARAVVEARVAACVNIVAGVRSVYRWEGRVTEETESLLVIKTAAAAVGRLRSLIDERHSYEVPEFLELDVSGGSPGYLGWLLAQVGGEG